MKPPGAPEVPMGARRRKGLIETKVRAEILQIFEKRPESKCVFGTNKATKYDPGPSDHFDRHGLEQKMLWGRLGASRLALDFRPGHPLGADFKVSLKIPLARAHSHRLCGEAGDRGGGMRPEWALNRTSYATSLAMRRTSSLSRLCGTEGVRGVIRRGKEWADNEQRK